MKGAIYVQDSGNAKLMGSEKIDATYAAIKSTCSSTCPLKDAGCYASLSYCGFINARNERRARGADALSVARAEARAIDDAYNGKAVPAGRMLRLHVSGDSRTIKGTRVINTSIKRWKARGGGDAYSYTHSWAHVPRKEWSQVSVLASIESVDQVEAVRKQGYAPALVVPEFASDKAFKISGCETTFIPCPAQTKDDVGCSDCKLCCRSDWLYETNRGIAFAAHGVKQKELKRHLTVIT